MLEPNSAQAIAMTLHELATNAAKYGALSAAEGQIEVKWSHTATDASPSFGQRLADRPEDTYAPGLRREGH